MFSQVVNLLICVEYASYPYFIKYVCNVSKCVYNAYLALHDIHLYEKLSITTLDVS